MQHSHLRFSLYCVVFLLFAQVVFAQNIIPRFEHLGVNDGMPHSSVYSILQDKKGFMWFGTPDGLCRYDGSVLQTFKYNATSTYDVVNNFVRAKIFEDTAGNIWYSNESGIYKWDAHKEKIIRVKAFKKEEYNNVGFCIVSIDDNNVLWLFNVVNGIFSYNIATTKFNAYPLPVGSFKPGLLLAYTTLDNNGNIWLRIMFGSKDPYLVFNKTLHTYTTQLVNNPPHAIFFGKEKTVFAYDDKLVYKSINGNEENTVIKSINNKKISFYSFEGVRDKYGRLWMTARGNGVFYYDEINNRFKQYYHDNSKIKSLPFDLTTCLYIDRSENLWIGIDGGGVAKLDLKQPKFNLFPLSEGDYPILNDYFTKCFYEDEKGRIWFGSHNNGLSILDNKTQQLTNFHYDKNNPNSIPGNIVGNILKDKDGNIWVGSSGGISLFDENKKTFKNVKLQGLPILRPEMNIFVYKMIQLQNGSFAVATLNGLVKIIKQPNGTYVASRFNHIPSLTSTCSDVLQMPNGTIYIAFPMFGLYELKKQGTEYIISNISLNGLDIRSVRMDETNTDSLWVSTGKGLIHFDTKTHEYSLLNEKNGLANSYVYGSLEDEKHNLWLSTNGGLSYINNSTKHIDNYTYQDGLQSNEFNTQSFYKSSTNTFYFGGINGFNWFLSKPLVSNLQKPQVAITQMEVDNLHFDMDSALAIHPFIQLPYNRNDINFKFAALDYTRPEANTVQYKLENWDTKWITTFAKSVRYSKLPPGQYEIKVKASNAAGIWSNEQTLAFTIEKPFWASNLFYFLVVVLLMLSIIFITYSLVQRGVKQKLQKLEKQAAINAERYRISRDMHDEIGTGLTQISLISEAAKSQSNSGNEINDELEDISVTSRQMVDNISEIIWALNPLHDKLDTLLGHLREQLNKLLEYAKIEYSINFPINVPSIELNNHQLRNILLVTKEIVHNALKHSRASKLSIKATLVQHTLAFTVTDNGKGFDENITYNGNGLKNIRRRVEELQGTINIKSKMGEGTFFVYSFVI